MKTLLKVLLWLMTAVSAHAFTQEEIYERALLNTSTAPNFIVVTIRGPDGTWNDRCVEAPFLLGALHREYEIPNTDVGRGKVLQMALSMASRRRFTFHSRKAIDNLPILYARDDLVEVERKIARLPVIELSRRLKDGSLCADFGGRDRYQRLRNALAHALIKRGIEVGRSCLPPFDLYLGNAGIRPPKVHSNAEKR